MSEVLEVTDSSFDENVVQKKGLVLVDFWAPWCAPCRMLSPVIEEVAANSADVDFYKLNVDSEQETAAKLGIRNIPTILLFKDGNLVARQVGALNKKQLEAFIEQAK